MRKRNRNEEKIVDLKYLENIAKEKEVLKHLFLNFSTFFNQ